MIPEAAVEAAARVTFEALYDDERWDDEPPADRGPFLDQARAALEAAARNMQPTIKPRDMYHIQAVALREAFHEFPLETITAPDSAAVWMNRRADELERKAEHA